MGVFGFTCVETGVLLDAIGFSSHAQINYKYYLKYWDVLLVFCPWFHPWRSWSSVTFLVFAGVGVFLCMMSPACPYFNGWPEAKALVDAPKAKQKAKAKAKAKATASWLQKILRRDKFGLRFAINSLNWLFYSICFQIALVISQNRLHQFLIFPVINSCKSWKQYQNQNGSRQGKAKAKVRVIKVHGHIRFEVVSTWNRLQLWMPKFRLSRQQSYVNNHC